MSQADVPIDPDATRIRTAAGHCFRHRSDNVLVRPEIAIVANPASYFRTSCDPSRSVSMSTRRISCATREFSEGLLGVISDQGIPSHTIAHFHFAPKADNGRTTVKRRLGA
jgi:hypothetical protein